MVRVFKCLLSAGAVLLLIPLGGASFLVSSKSKAPAEPAAEETIPVEPLGYRPPGQLYMLSGRTFSSLDFIDAHHLLFTFHESRLLRREEKSVRSDNGQMIRAVILGLPSGDVEEETEWRMRDRSRYLWPIGGGKFLVRQRDRYSLLDESLKLHAYIDVATPVTDTEISPDGQVLVIEHEYERHAGEPHVKLAPQILQLGESSPQSEETQISVIDTVSREVLQAIHTESPVKLPVTSNGYIGVEKGQSEDEFSIRFFPFEGKPLVLGKVASTCTPHEEFLNQKALVIESCGPRTTDVFLDAWTTEGRKLWSGRRDGRLIWPNFAYSRNGKRFAVSLLRMAHTVDLVDSIIEEDVREQVVQVFDTATGAQLFATTASPVLTGGQNFALSEDGDRLAVLRKGAIEIYKVPKATPDEKETAKEATKEASAAEK